MCGELAESFSDFGPSGLSDGGVSSRLLRGRRLALFSRRIARVRFLRRLAVRDGRGGGVSSVACGRSVGEFLSRFVLVSVNTSL